MKPTSTTPVPTITELCVSIEKIARESAAADTAVTTASEEYKIAKNDDGTTDPALIFDRKTAAKKKLFIAEAEAKRAAKRLESATAEFETAVGSLEAPLVEKLTKIRNQNAERLTGELVSKLPKANRTAPSLATSALRDFVACCEGVWEYDTAIASIAHTAPRLESHGPQASGLIGALKRAEALL